MKRWLIVLIGALSLLSASALADPCDFNFSTHHYSEKKTSGEHKAAALHHCCIHITAVQTAETHYTTPDRHIQKSTILTSNALAFLRTVLPLLEPPTV